MLPPGMALAAAASPIDPAVTAKAWKAAQDFEAVTLDQFLQPMFSTIDLSGTPFGGGEAEKTWQSMFVSELGKQMQRAGGVGIAKSVYTEMLRMQEQANGGGRRATAAIATTPRLPVTPLAAGSKDPA